MEGWSGKVFGNMKRMIIMVGATAGGWLGWWLGGHVGIFMALVLSMIGTGAGLYFTRRLIEF
jgi:hypothetical protein